MSETIDKLKQAFQEEARELLAELESSLLELDQSREDTELLGRAFRALHTIKGSGAMFGFEDIAGFAHNLENAFDRMRSGELAVTGDLINLGLVAGDQIKTMLDRAEGRGQVDEERTGAILADLQKLTGAPDPATVSSGAAVLEADAATDGQVLQWQVHFQPHPGILMNGANPLLLIEELRQLGQLWIELDTTAIPPLTEIQAEECYLRWNMILTTAADVEAIRDVFIFVEDQCDLLIEAVPGQSAHPMQAEERVQKAEQRSGPGSPSSLRVSVDKLDQLVNLVGELVTVQARLSEVAARSDDGDIVEISEAVDRLTSALRDNSMSIRMLPLKTTVQRFHRLVHDLGTELGKEVELTIEGAETELDKTVLDQLNDPLVHLIRNSLDHGIEKPEVRRAAGKRPTGTIHLSARHSGANVLIRISDDGRGLDVDAVRAKAIRQGLMPESAHLTETEVFSFIMSAGFSTASKVTEVSGRGVGMDVVKRSIEALHGSINIASKPGQGVTVTLVLPLTLAIIDGLLVRVGDTHFVLPLADSLECVELTREDIEESHGKHIAHVRGQLIPYIRLSEYFQMTRPQPDREQIMIVETERGRYGFVVDEVLGDHQTVIKNLGKLYRNVQAVSGATILGNGTVALILDPHRLVNNIVEAAIRNSRHKNAFD
jgi:two-component system chemotaxis sensor kinase CheA